MTTYLEQVAAAGYETLTTVDMVVDPVAARMIPDDPHAIGVALAGDVIRVIVDVVPTPARFSELERVTGLAVSVAVTTPQNLAQLAERARATPTGHASQVLSAVLTDASSEGASDVLLVTGQRPVLRVGGRRAVLDNYPLLPEQTVRAAKEWLIGAAARGMVTVGGHRWRVQTGSSQGTELLTLRSLPSIPPRLDEIHAPVALLDAATQPSGLIVIASKPAAGRTTTASALVEHVNTNRAVHICCVGAPVEYQHPRRQAVITSQEIPTDAPDAPAAVAHARALGADVLVLAVHTLDDARAALAAATAGHLVVVEIAAVSVTEALRALITLFPPDERLWAATMTASALRAVTAQVLLPTTGGQQMAAFESLTTSDAVRTAVRTATFEHLPGILEDEAGAGTSSLARSLALLAASGRVHHDVARHVLGDPAVFDAHLAQTVTSTTSRPLPQEPEPPLPDQSPVGAPQADPESPPTRRTTSRATLRRDNR